MNAHLNSQQVAEWLAGEVAEDTVRHLAECAGCRASAEDLRRALAAFRDGVHDLGASRLRDEFVLPALPKSRPGPSVTWLAAVAAVVVLAVLLFLPGRPATVAEPVRADAALLQNVDAALSRSVPESMEPLLKLVASEGGTEGRAANRPKNR